ncbi:hypothetical protein JOD54_004895 [Actinokineospora baliensis]|uniref:hypothetical protein n=1 Tax=Actinokineospora baliensis TaxID=547056 RepID=UPI0019562CA0|nr:hypothetical protein [Actinokineospora baliensis]MBM7774691.1 hypothetical protein [Actinokineospora baliensis]
MIEVESYLRLPGGEFRPVAGCAWTPPVPTHIEGAVELRLNGEEIIGRSTWDYVDQLWAYIVDMLEEFTRTPRVSTYFPDQPVELSFEARRGRVEVTSRAGAGVRRSSVERVAFVGALKAAGDRFFADMTEVAPRNAADYSLLRNRLAAVEPSAHAG